ncbi:MAG: PKD domain-containing protein [Nitrospirota bacterium]|nr:PKD domain-containing protein [Nitrospirota bacterium]
MKRQRGSWAVITGLLSLMLVAGCTQSGIPEIKEKSNTAPVALAGPGQQVITGAVVTLDGSGSSDADGDTLTYRWSFSSMPAGSTAALSSEIAGMPTFTTDKDGDYLLTLVVNDGTVDSSAAAVVVTATANTAPVADAGLDRAVSTGTVVTLDGSASSDAEGGTLTYVWSFITKPAGSTAVFSNATGTNPTFTADKDGNYVVSLVVNDGMTDSAPAVVTLSATTANVPPVANAGSDRNVTTGSVATLDGSKSSDAEGSALTYQWTFTSMPVGSSAVLSSETSGQPTFTADKDGAYVFGLVVNDGIADSAPATVTLTAVMHGVKFKMPDTRQLASYTTTTGEDSDYTINQPSYTDNGDGTVTDNVTTLIWQQGGDGVRKTWNEADTYCRDLALAGQSDWRLPNRLELASLVVDNGIGNTMIDAVFPTWSSYYWASTTSVSHTVPYAWSVDFYDGVSLYNLKSRPYYARCVRGGP